MAFEVGSEGPDKTLDGPSGTHVRVFGHVSVVIKVYKIVGIHLPVNGKGGHDQKKADNDFRTVLFHVRIILSGVCQGLLVVFPKIIPYF